MIAVFKREFLSYFRSPVGYIAIALFSFLSGYIFVNNFATGAVNIASEVISLRSFFVVIVPIITMGLFAEDKKRGTEILYYTSPIDLFSVVAGKFLAAFCLYGIMFVNVFIHMIVTKSCDGIVDIGAWGSVIVFFFLAMLFISIGIFASAITDSQIIAAIFSFIMIMVIQLLSTISSLAGNAIAAFLSMLGVASESSNSVGEAITNGINWLDPFAKTSDFRYGSFSVAPLVFCISFAIVFLFLTFRVLEKKRWAKS
ncbi:ABC-2 type transport system permease protein [Ruminococcaceae bacterium YRB3002]|nr:ABC-2 type transport system permease protein [Ruminococcaceae bacterium YRB3002]